MANVPGTNTGHGHVWPRPDGAKARCGGPRMCSKCQADKAAFDETVVVTVVAQQVIVEVAPPATSITIEALRAPHLFASGDRIYSGNDRDGNEVVYQIVGWQAEPPALNLRRVAP